jgi:predicted metal-dependent phosphoesterase TrpH
VVRSALCALRFQPGTEHLRQNRRSFQRTTHHAPRTTFVIDLHVHSTASDGSESPTVVVQLAAAAGLTAIALTDHDTQAGIIEARAEAVRTGVELIAGTELSVEWAQGAMHMVVLFLEPGPGPLQDRLAELRRGRSERNTRIVERLIELGLPITDSEIGELAAGESVGRPHIAAVMVQRGYVESIFEAFDRYLAWGKPAYMARPRLSPEEAIGLALESPAVPLIAHPHTLGLNTSEEVSTTLRRLAAAGLVGIECYYPLYSPFEREGYAALAERFGLKPSGGSDYHGTYKPDVELGVGRGNLAVADELLDALRPA